MDKPGGFRGDGFVSDKPEGKSSDGDENSEQEGATRHHDAFHTVHGKREGP